MRAFLRFLGGGGFSGVFSFYGGFFLLFCFLGFWGGASLFCFLALWGASFLDLRVFLRGVFLFLLIFIVRSYAIYPHAIVLMFVVFILVVVTFLGISIYFPCLISSLVVT